MYAGSSTETGIKSLARIGTEGQSYEIPLNPPEPNPSVPSSSSQPRVLSSNSPLSKLTPSVSSSNYGKIKVILLEADIEHLESKIHKHEAAIHLLRAEIHSKEGEIKRRRINY
ncbi:hypothetical protein EDC94DRAFT_693835 [Helicostylum pulchrum]|nr:hypothetical protein EDC94DRAFT_693835 [Helicostylum pulchrum]